MSEHVEQAIEELKRADHLIFVSLKYTRTCDVIKNIVERLVTCFDFVFDYFAEYLKDTKKIEEVPQARAKKIEVVNEYFKNNAQFREYYEFYMKLRKINKAEFTRRQEFRRHVTMTVILEDNCPVELNIDSIHEYYLKTKEFLDFAMHLIEPKED